MRPEVTSALILVVMSESDDKVAVYREAYETWQRHLAPLHEFFLEKQRIDPLRLKGVLNREARSKRRYDAARLRLLGIEDDGHLFDDDDAEEDE
jgi:hypothetical protein